MQVVVSLLHHFRKTPDGTVYPYSVFDYTFWRRYLDVFDEVIVFARMEHIDDVDPATMPARASGPGVSFVELPDFLGAWQYLKKYPQISACAGRVLANDVACVLRVPGYLSTMVWRRLMKTGQPYAVEVVGDPWQSLSPGSHTSVLRSVLRRKFTWDMVRQCRHSTVSAYVTQYELQKRYPPGDWSTYYSSIELPPEFIVEEAEIEKRIETIDLKAKSNGPWRLCFVGSLWHLCKSPDVVIDAVADCVRKGLNLELTMIGGGSLMGALQDRAEKNNLSGRVTFLGQLPPGKAILDKLRESDLFVLPSRSEGLPRAIIEAFALGLPCIGGSEGGFPELLEEKYMVNPIETEVLSRTIMDVISDVDGLKEAVGRNVKKATEYRSDTLQKRRIELYTRLKKVTQDWLK